MIDLKELYFKYGIQKVYVDERGFWAIEDAHGPQCQYLYVPGARGVRICVNRDSQTAPSVYVQVWLLNSHNSEQAE